MHQNDLFHHLIISLRSQKHIKAFFSTQKVHCAIHEILQNKNKISVEFNLSSNYKLNYFQPFACFTPNIDKTHHSLYIPQYTVSTSHSDG